MKTSNQQKIQPTHVIGSNIPSQLYWMTPKMIHIEDEMLWKGAAVYEVVESDDESCPGIWVDCDDGRYLVDHKYADCIEEIVEVMP